MRLYLSGNSKLGVGYTPDTLIIDLKGKHYEYDVSGWTDFDPHTLSTRTKGDLKKFNNRKQEYVQMNETGYKHLLKLLRNPESQISIAIYPVNEDQYEDASKDIITETVGTFQYIDKEASFKFYTEFYGI